LHVTDLFHRQIDIKFTEVGEDRLGLRASVQDAYHDITLSLDISLPEYCIESAAVSMERVPSEMCHCIEPAVEKLVGTKIAKGFYRRIRNLFGGMDGCINLYQLLSFAAPLAINVSWRYQESKGQIDRADLQKIVHRDMQGRCIAFPSGGSP